MPNDIVPTNNRSDVKKEQWEFASLLCEGAMSVVDAYIKSHPALTEADLLDRRKLSNKAYEASRQKGVQRNIEKIQQQMTIEEARLLVWDKRKASQYLMQKCADVDANMKIMTQLRDQLLLVPTANPDRKIKLMQSVTMSMNDTARVIRESIQEMNKLYGLTNPEVNMAQAVQIIIKAPESLPEDTTDREA